MCLIENRFRFEYEIIVDNVSHTFTVLIFNEIFLEEFNLNKKSILERQMLSATSPFQRYY